MSIKISISLDNELAKLIKKEAEVSGRTVSEIFADAVRAYRKEKRRQAYINIAKSKKIELFEEAQLETIRKLK